ncbi:malonyl- acyl- carrier protein transacylase [Cyclospora cayetanensis]|uniref:Malonyl-acyl-carrier protein transacylase n=1 Tax=Cyclospora cayetanensis TaxID=88456 RepID=A0A1D3D8S2_9EIME|nr:malonyl- acyl- carrier protein transacylase [Cyclospora cayetanensis]
MGVACARSHAPSRRLFEEASEILQYDLLRLLEEGPSDKINKTGVAQPALLTTSLAVYTKWRDTAEEPVQFDACAGLSLGEYSALCFAGVLSFKDAVALTAQRGSLMQKAAEEHPGDMFAILANYLCKGNYAVSVSRAAAQALQEAATAAKAKRCIKLQVDGAFHSPLMAPAAEGLATAIESVPFNKPRIPIVLNVDAQIHTDPSVIKRKLLQQLTSPTQWQQSMEHLGELGVEESVEFGPGAVLTKLMNKINPTVRTLHVE